MSPNLKRILALILSLLVDGIQILLTPLLAVGIGEGVDDALDLFMAIILTLMLGFHWAYLPAFTLELIPVVDEFPFWTLAVLATWGGKGSKGVEGATK